MKKDWQLIMLSIVTMLLSAILVGMKEVSWMAVVLGVVQFLIVIYAVKSQGKANAVPYEGYINADSPHLKLKKVGEAIGTEIMMRPIHEDLQRGKGFNNYRAIFWINGTMKIEMTVSAPDKDGVAKWIDEQYPNSTILSIRNEKEEVTCDSEEMDRPHFLRKIMD